MKISRLTFAASVTLLFSFTQAKSSAQDIGIVAPVRCERSTAPSCGEDPTLEEAARYYGQIGDKEAVRYYGQTGDKPPSTMLRIITSGDAKCEAHWPSVRVWAPSEKVKGGNEAAATLVKRARTGEVFGDNQVIVEASGSKPEERHLALCSVQRIYNVTGPPEDCITVAIITPSQTWLRAANDNCLMAAGIGFDRVLGAINIEFDVSTAIHVGAFTDSIKKTLESDMLLTADKVVIDDRSGGYAYVKTVAAQRFSKVLPGKWWETLAFRLDLYSDVSGKKVSILGDAYVLVSEGPTGNLIEYRPLDDAQKEVYAKKLDDEVSKAIQMTCKNFKQRDAKTIICN